jgi:hypothetical protein
MLAMMKCLKKVNLLPFAHYTLDQMAICRYNILSDVATR